MHLDTVTVDRQFARVRFIEYRRAVRARHNAEDAQIMRGYREIARGRPVISLTATLRQGGRTDDGRGFPRLAVCRADAERCWLSACTAPGAVRFVTKRSNDGRGHNNVRDIRDFPTGTLAPLTAWHVVNDYNQNDLLTFRDVEELYAIVPNVPPALRPNAGLSNFDILWEVDQWRRDPAPPSDPALLRHIGGDLYAVVAQWDLTELERLVLAGR